MKRSNSFLMFYFEGLLPLGRDYKNSSYESLYNKVLIHDHFLQFLIDWNNGSFDMLDNYFIKGYLDGKGGSISERNYELSNYAINSHLDSIYLLFEDMDSLLDYLLIFVLHLKEFMSTLYIPVLEDEVGEINLNYDNERNIALSQISKYVKGWIFTFEEVEYIKLRYISNEIASESTFYDNTELPKIGNQLFDRIIYLQNYLDNSIYGKEIISELLNKKLIDLKKNILIFSIILEFSLAHSDISFYYECKQILLNQAPKTHLFCSDCCDKDLDYDNINLGVKNDINN